MCLSLFADPKLPCRPAEKCVSADAGVSQMKAKVRILLVSKLKTGKRLGKGQCPPEKHVDTRKTTKGLYSSNALSGQDLTGLDWRGRLGHTPVAAAAAAALTSAIAILFLEHFLELFIARACNRRVAFNRFFQPPCSRVPCLRHRSLKRLSELSELSTSSSRTPFSA